MNALLGMVLRRADRERLLVPLPRETRIWGDEIFEVGDVKYQYSGLPRITFNISMLTAFVSNLLPETWVSEEMEFARISGDCLKEYADCQWRVRFRMDDPFVFQYENELAQKNALVFEEGLGDLIEKLPICAIFLSSDDKLGDVVQIDTVNAISLLREGMMNLTDIEGFVAVINTD